MKNMSYIPKINTVRLQTLLKREKDFTAEMEEEKQYTDYTVDDENDFLNDLRNVHNLINEEKRLIDISLSQNELLEYIYRTDYTKVNVLINDDIKNTVYMMLDDITIQYIIDDLSCYELAYIIQEDTHKELIIRYPDNSKTVYRLYTKN